MSRPDDDALQFPCPFPIKVMAESADDFANHVLALVTPHAPELDADALELRHSSGGRYVSVTVRLVAHSRAQLDAIYQALSDDPRVIMAL